MIPWFKSHKINNLADNGLIQFSYLGTRAKIAFSDEYGSSNFQQFVNTKEIMNKFDINIINFSPHVSFIVRNLPQDMERKDWERYQSIFNCEKITVFKDRNNKPSNADMLSATIDTKNYLCSKKQLFDYMLIEFIDRDFELDI
ncbi:hypothetical protein GJ496_003291 [Pomphorhynchus laevis]|nr:hypothetical protein GJ496_003291 [Pomphorhynchus laevis]